MAFLLQDGFRFLAQYFDEFGVSSEVIERVGETLMRVASQSAVVRPWTS